jgi:hypothetical protein
VIAIFNVFSIPLRATYRDHDTRELRGVNRTRSPQDDKTPESGLSKVVSRGVVEIERSVVILSAVVGAVASGRQ